ncbi:MAG: flippase-like domain-containing protein [Ferruginibacter sp.]|nr:flippase-like domain-containing protein [Ferruginibacter sp.]
MDIESTIKQPQEFKVKQILKSLLKVLITVFCFWYIQRKIDFARVGSMVHFMNYPWMLLALASFVVSKIVSSYRLNLYFKAMGIRMTQTSNLRLYWLGMFYNLFLPGSISGDAYKVIRLTKVYKKPAKQVTAAVVFDRFSGLLNLGLLLVIFWILVQGFTALGALFIASALLAVLVCYLVCRRFFPYLLLAFWRTFALGMIVQVLQVACMFAILQALYIETHSAQYLLVFLVSCVVAVLPFTIGGLGAREMVFLWGASLFLLDAEQSVLGSIAFYAVTVTASLPGLVFVFFDPLPANAETIANK